MKPTVGRIVHYTLPEGRSAGEVRPAEIVRVWNDTCVNLQVKLDGANDAPIANATPSHDNPLLAWRTSVIQGGPDRPGTWFWPPRIEAPPAREKGNVQPVGPTPLA